ncbi:MAG: FHA domain-containing protein [Oligoflexia bacterium]|nr:FHA domain-containing protein [Oligoflexia bacterium]
MKLSIFKNNNIFIEKELDTSCEYILGRSSQCDIVLAEPEISRKHARLIFKNKAWVCEIISDNGFLTVGASSLKELSLTDGSKFQIGGFELVYNEVASKTFDLGQNEEKTNVESLSEKTNIDPAPVKFVLFREDSNGDPIEEIVLHEGPITAGRGDDCDIILNDPKASRRHFILEKKNYGYSIKDLNSTHGTIVSGNKVMEQKLEGGQRIQIGNEVFLYEEVHSAFENLPALAPTTSSEASNNTMQTYANYDQPVVKIGSSQNKLKPVFLALGVLLVAGIIGKLTENDKSKIKDTRQISSVSSPSQANNLTDAQKKFIDETYNLALSLYTSGKYDLAALELAKIFQLTPNYKDAKNIEALSKQAIELKRQSAEVQRLAREQNELKQRIDGILAECDQLYNNKKYSQVEPCVAQIIDMDPENLKAKELVENANLKLYQIENTQAAREAAAQRAQAAKQIFARAQSALKEKRYPAAARDFAAVERMSFNDSQNLKAKAQSGLKYAKEQMLSQSQAFVNEGKSALEQKEFKNAIVKFNKALELFSENKEAAEFKKRALSELRLEVKTLYSESVIEEDLGNIESAKKKWRIILENNIPSDPYYQKAKNKINKYEK